jgi:hypothetical protein
MKQPGRRSERAVRGSIYSARSLHLPQPCVGITNETAEAVCACLIRRQPGGNVNLFNAEVAEAQRNNVVSSHPISSSPSIMKLDLLFQQRSQSNPPS